MTGPEHYREAEQLLAQAARNFLHGDDPTGALAAAQAHATLALAAATVEQASNAALAADINSGTLDDWHETTHAKASTGAAS